MWCLIDRAHGPRTTFPDTTDGTSMENGRGRAPRRALEIGSTVLILGTVVLALIYVLTRLRRLDEDIAYVLDAERARSDLARATAIADAYTQPPSRVNDDFTSYSVASSSPSPSPVVVDIGGITGTDSENAMSNHTAIPPPSPSSPFPPSPSHSPAHSPAPSPPAPLRQVQTDGKGGVLGVSGSAYDEVDADEVATEVPLPTS